VLELVVAASRNDVIGRGNRLPWHLPADLKHFKALTLGRHVLMGKNTYLSIGKALPNRVNLVMSRDPGFAPADCTVVGSFDAAERIAGNAPLMVIGGAQIYAQCVDRAARIHLTLVETDVADGDAFFAAWRAAPWHEVWREAHPPDEKNPLGYTFLTLEPRRA
jgi:dihydrofolate reductase